MAKPKASAKPKETKPPVEGELVTSTEEAVTDLQAALPPAEPRRESALSIVGGITTAELKQALEIQTEQRKLIQEFISDNLIVDIDYGKIHVIKECPAYKRGDCKTDYHYSKSILFKPGQEKIFSLFGITDELVKDTDAYEMLDQVTGLVAYKCIMRRGDKVVGEGRGAATLSGTQNDPNSTIKKAEKRARMDGCLSLGFSAYFTQDLDDPEYKSQREMMNERARMDAEARDKDEFGLMPRDAAESIDEAERKTLFAMILKYGVDKFYVVDSLKLNGITDPTTMTSGQARSLMGLIKSGIFKKPDQPVVDPEPEPDADEVITNIDDIDPATALEEATVPETTAMFDDPDLTVDDDLKEFVSNQFDSIGLSSWGKRWLFTKICGRPLADWKKLVDYEWIKAYQMVMALHGGEFIIPEEYHTKTPPAPRNPAEPTLTTARVQELVPGATVEGGETP